MSALTKPYRLAGRGPLPAHLAVANGFPPEVYRPLVEALAEDLTVWALTPLAMRNPPPPPSRLRWTTLAEDMARHLQAAQMSHLLGIGHSLGGTLSLLAAAHDPHLFRALVLLDPVIFPYRYLLPLALLRFLGLHHRFPLAAQARRRRAIFPSREAAAEHYRSRPLFRHWHPDAFRAYIAHGLVPREDGPGYRLAYAPAWEAAIFANIPIEAWRAARRVHLPILVLYGARSNTFLPPARRRLQRLWPQADFIALPEAGHMFPMERPQETAQIIRNWLAKINSGSGPAGS